MNENNKKDEDKTFWLIVPPESPCGCGSGKSFGDCHLEDGNVKLSSKNINPPMPLTGQNIKKCYFAFTNNCGGGISKEHIISRTVLSKINDKQIDFTRDGITRTYSLDSSSFNNQKTL